MKDILIKYAKGVKDDKLLTTVNSKQSKLADEIISYEVKYRLDGNSIDKAVDYDKYRFNQLEICSAIITIHKYDKVLTKLKTLSLD